MRMLVVDSLYKLMDKFEDELNGLYGDLRELSGNRKYNFLEAESVLMADSYLDFVIERLSGFILRSDIPKDLQNRVEHLLNLSYEIRDFIYENFEDVFRNNYDFRVEAG